VKLSDDREILLLLFELVLKKEDYEIKIIEEQVSDFGPFKGIQFDKEEKGGLFYLWQNGNIQIHLVDYINGKEKIKDKLMLNEEIDFPTIEAFFRAVSNLEIN
jgi:hypothetical protein